MNPRYNDLTDALDADIDAQPRFMRDSVVLILRCRHDAAAGALAVAILAGAGQAAHPCWCAWAGKNHHRAGHGGNHHHRRTMARRIALRARQRPDLERRR